MQPQELQPQERCKTIAAMIESCGNQIAMTHERIKSDAARIAEFCRRHSIRRLSLFGSILRDDFADDSDIDVLVEFAPGQTPSLLDLGGMQVELSDLFGREVDLKTPGFLSARIRQRVAEEAQVQYAA